MLTPTHGHECESLRRKRKLKDMVKAILRDIPDTRNSDTLLTAELWKRYYGDMLIQSQRTGRWAVMLERLGDLPREDSIKRIRATYQNTEKIYPPTTWEAAKARGYEEWAWRLTLGYSNPLDQKQNVLQQM